MRYFYNGLKERVKDELIRNKRLDNLAEYIGITVEIDNRLY